MQKKKVKNETHKSNLKLRIYTWVLLLIHTLEKLPPNTTTNVLSRQLMRSGTSIGANFVEGRAASSRKDLTNYLQIALKSANESKYWIALLRDIRKISRQDSDMLLQELDQISRMLAASVITLKKNIVTKK